MKSNKLAIPYLFWLTLFTIVPIFILIQYTFTSNAGGFTFDNLARFFTPLYLGVLWHSFVMAFKATILCFTIGYPIAYILSSKEYRKRTILVLLFIVPMWMNFLVRTYTWLFILGNNGVLNNLLALFGFDPVHILFTDTSVLLGLVYTFLPFMIYPVYSSLQKIDDYLLEAGQDLGASHLHIFTKIIFPLSLPGVASGLTMVFMPAVATFLVSNILGGAQYMMIGNLIEQQFLVVGNRHFGAAISLILLVLIFLFNVLMSYFNKEEER